MVLKLILAIDIGGSKILLGLVHNGKLIKTFKQSINKKEPLKKQLFKAIDSVFSKDILSIKVACPGIGDFLKGEIYYGANINAKRFNIKKALEERYKTKVFIDNDANCFSLYEWKRLKIYKNLVGITLGTGLGFGVIINNKILYGNGLTSELGHIIVKDVELEEEYKNIILNSPFKSFKEAYDSKKKEKYKVFENLANIVSITLYNAILAYAPEIIVLGGGVTKAKDLFLKGTNKKLSQLLKRYNIKKPKIKIDSSDFAVLKGAALLKQKHKLK